MDPSFAPIDLGISAYYKEFSGSAICLLQETLLAAKVDQQLTKSHSLDDLSNAPPVQSCIMTKGSYSKSSGDVSEAVNERNRSCPSLSNSPYVEYRAGKAGVINIKPSKPKEDHLGIVFDFPDSSASAVDSTSGPCYPLTDHSGINFDFTESCYSTSSDKSLVGYDPSPKDSLESISTTDTEMAEEEVLSTTLRDVQDLSDAEGEAESAPTNQSGYMNITGDKDSLDESLSFSFLSPDTPSDTSIAFAMVEQPTGATKPHHLPNSDSQMDSGSFFESNSSYMNTSSGYTGKFTFSCTVDSTSYTSDLSSEFTTEPSIGVSNSDYQPESSEGCSSCSNAPSQHQPSTPPSTYISESDLSNITAAPIFEPQNGAMRLPRTVQPTTSPEANFAGEFSLLNSSVPGYIIVGNPTPHLLPDPI